MAVGHPIDVATGEFFAPENDHEVEGVVSLTLSRTFNTRFLAPPMLGTLDVPSEHYLPFGPGWRAGWLLELRATLDGFMFTTADGTELPLADPNDELARAGRLIAPAHGIELQRIGPTSVRLVEYDAQRDPTSVLFELTATQRYRLAALERTAAARVDFLYDPATGIPSAIVQRREGRAYILEHTGGRLTRVSLRLADGSVRSVLEYEYDDRGQLSELHDQRGLAKLYVYDADGRLVREEKRGGSVYTVRYDGSGRCIYAAGTNRYEERALRFDVDARTTFVTDSHGGVTTYEWNEHGQVIKTMTPSGIVTQATFDEFGRPSSYTTASGALHEIDYDDRGRIVEERASSGPTKQYVQDDANRIVEARVVDRETGELLRIERAAYDDDHNIISQQLNDDPPWLYRWSTFGEPTRFESPSSAVRHLEYGALGGVVRETNFDGNTWSWTRDLYGRPTSEKNPLGDVWQVDYLDEDGASYQLREPDGRAYTRRTSLDQRTIEERLPGGVTRLLELSFCGELLAIRDEEGAVTRLEWGTEPGDLTRIINTNGAEYRFGYDADLRIVSRRTFDGRVLRAQWTGDDITASWDAAGAKTEYERDARGLVVVQRDADGETTFDYDALGNVVRARSGDSELIFEHDSNGQIVAEKQGRFAFRRTFDTMGNVTGTDSSLGLQARFDFSPEGFLRSFQYRELQVGFTRDALGRETRRDLANSGAFTQAYDPVGRLLSQRFAPSVTSGNDLVRELAYDARGFLSDITDSLRGHTRLRHNARGDLTAAIRDGSASDFFAYDGEQNRTYRARTMQGVALAQALDLESLAGRPDTLQRASASVAHTAEIASHASGNRLERIQRVDGHIDLRYDANGNVIEKIVTHGAQSEIWNFRWNARGELAAVTTPNEKVWSYQYDAFGRRTTKASPTGDTWHYAWLGLDLVHTLKNDALVETYVHQPDGACPLLRDDGAIHFILPNQNDSPSEEIAADGEVGWRREAEPFGERFAPSGATGGQPFLGQWHDAESGLHYNLFRYYDPETGRFLSPDPIDLDGGPNLYIGATAPFSEFDRYGLDTALGKAGEASAERWLKRNGYKPLGSVQNKSGHGIDLVAVRQSDNALVVVEVKVNSSRLSRSQAKGPAKFGDSRASRALNKWNDVDAKTRRLAKRVRKAVKNKTVQGLLIHVSIQPGKKTKLKAKKWCKT